MVAELRGKGYFQEGALGMSHTEAQMEFMLGRAAMITCGTWLPSEMRKQTPPGFHMDFFNAPVVRNGRGDPTITCSGVETWIVPKEAKHPDIGADFYKFMTSLPLARRFVVEKKNLMSVIGSDQVDLPRELASAAKCMRNAKEIWDTDILYWYPAMNRKVESAMAGLLSGELTPKQCVDAMERAAEETRTDPSVLKHKVE
jgi:N-acetylglucosamine transport system substrate-binding protein